MMITTGSRKAILSAKGPAVRALSKSSARLNSKNVKTTPLVLNTPPVIKTTPPVIKTSPPVVKTTPLVIKGTPPPVVIKAPPPPPPVIVESSSAKNDKKKKKFSLFKLLFRTALLSSVVYGGTLYVATKNDKVMDFVIDQQLPYYEELLDIIEKGSFEDLKNKVESLLSQASHLSLPSKDQIDELTHKLEKTSGDLIKETKERLTHSGKKSSHSTDATPAQQLQKPVEIESIKKDIKELPLITLNKEVASSVDDSVKLTIDSINSLIKSIDATAVPSNPGLINNINEKVLQLAKRVNALTKTFDEELKSKLKVSQTELLSSYTKKELELTENLLHQFTQEKSQLEQKLNARLAQEIEATKDTISQAAVNAVSMVRIEQTKNFEKLITDRVDQERKGRLANLEKLNERLTELEAFSSSLETQLVSNHQKLLIHKSILKLKTLLFSSDPLDRPQLIKPYLENLSKVSADSNDELITLALKDLSQLLANESSQSILTTSQLLSRWEQLVPELRSASLLPPNAGVLGHLSSVIFSKLLISVKGNKPNAKDIESVIGRVESSLIRGDLDLAVEEVANLKGWSRKLADDWVIQSRKRLEAEFLINLIDAESRVL
jgi:mitofilin